MKKLLILSLFCTLFLSCTKEIKQVDPTKKERTSAYYELQALLEKPDSDFRDSLIAAGAMTNREADLHHWRLVQAFKIMEANNCFELFKKKNEEIALACKALSEAPESVWRKVMLTLPGEGFVSPGPLMIREIQNAKLSRLRTKVIEKRLLTPHEVYTTPSAYLRFVLFLDGQVKPMYRNDPFYLLLRQMLLDSRPDQKRSAKDVLDITLLNDTIVIDGEAVGSLSKLKLQAPKVEARFHSQVTKYTERKEPPQKSLLKNDEPEIAPDFFEKDKPVAEESPLKEQKKDLPSGGCGRDNKKTKGVLQSIKENRLRNALKDAPPLPRNVASITVDNKISVPDLYTIIEAVNSHQINEFSIYADSYKGAHFRTVIPHIGKGMKIMVDTVEHHSSSLILRGVSEKEMTNIVYLSMPGSVTNAIEIINTASQERIALVQFIKSRTIYNRNKNSTLQVNAKPILSAKDIEGTGILSGVLSATQPGSATPSQNGLSGLTGRSIHSGKINDDELSKKNHSGVRGNRSRANIMRTVRNNMASLKYAYNRRLRAKPGLKGKIVVKWAIDEFGHVLYCKVVSSTMKDPTFEKELVSKVKRWAFGRIPTPGDVTEVTYPFVFNN